MVCTRKRKSCEEADNSAAPAAKKAASFKYSNPDTVPTEPVKYVNVAWPPEFAHHYRSGRRKYDCDCPKNGVILNQGNIKKTSDMGFPLSEEGAMIMLYLDGEEEKRDQDSRGIYISCHWNGYGKMEVMENFLRNFSKFIFKKTASPLKKWAYVEGLAGYLKGGDQMVWSTNNDRKRYEQVINMFGTMLLTSLDMLSEHNLLTPDSIVPNIGIVSMLLIEFSHEWARGYNVKWEHEVIHVLSEVGINLTPRRQVSIKQEKLDLFKEHFTSKVNDRVEEWLPKEKKFDGNIYEFFAARGDDWVPKDDIDTSDDYNTRMWARWDWKKEYAEFAKHGRGGTHFCIDKMSQKKRKQRRLDEFDY